MESFFRYLCNEIKKTFIKENDYSSNQYDWATLDNGAKICFDKYTGEIVAGPDGFDIENYKKSKSYIDKVSNHKETISKLDNLLKGNSNSANIKNSILRSIDLQNASEETLKKYISTFNNLYKNYSNVLDDENIKLKLSPEMFDKMMRPVKPENKSRLEHILNNIQKIKSNNKDLTFSVDFKPKKNTEPEVVINVSGNYNGNRAERLNNFSKMMNDIFGKDINDTECTESTIKMHIRDTSPNAKKSQSTSINANSYFGSSIGKSISIKGETFREFNSGDLETMKKHMIKNMNTNDQLSNYLSDKDKEYMRNIINCKSAGEMADMIRTSKGKMDTAIFTSFGEVIIPYMMLNIKTKEDVEKVQNLGVNLNQFNISIGKDGNVSGSITRIIYPESSSYKHVDYIVISDTMEKIAVGTNKTNEEIQESAEAFLERLRKDNPEAFISAKYKTGHAVGIDLQIIENEEKARKLLEKFDNENKKSLFYNYCTTVLDNKNLQKNVQHYLCLFKCIPECEECYKELLSIINSDKNNNGKLSKKASKNIKNKINEIFEKDKKVKSKVLEYFKSKGLTIDDRFPFPSLPSLIVNSIKKEVDSKGKENNSYLEYVRNLVIETKLCQYRINVTRDGVKLTPTMIDECIKVSLKSNTTANDENMTYGGIGFVIDDNKISSCVESKLSKANESYLNINSYFYKWIFEDKDFIDCPFC